jgi:hypothetical protein
MVDPNQQAEANKNSDKRNGIGLDTHYVKEQKQ